MFETAISFLGGTAFRLIFGSVMDWVKAKQEHQHELDMQRLQAELETARHARDLERIQVQSSLNIKEITVAGDVAEQKVMADAFLEAVRATGNKVGVAWVDAWNAAIRPSGATLSLTIWMCTMVTASFVLNDFDKGLIAAFLGIFVGDRIHVKGRV